MPKQKTCKRAWENTLCKRPRYSLRSCCAWRGTPVFKWSRRECVRRKRVHRDRKASAVGAAKTASALPRVKVAMLKSASSMLLQRSESTVADAEAILWVQIVCGACLQARSPPRRSA
eukprot:5721641-Pleurochrysis_carterae.AAC.2